MLGHNLENCVYIAGKIVKETYSVLKLAFNHEALSQSTALVW